jgi:hypothetical protein
VLAAVIAAGGIAAGVIAMTRSRATGATALPSAPSSPPAAPRAAAPLVDATIETVEPKLAVPAVPAPAVPVPAADAGSPGSPPRKPASGHHTSTAHSHGSATPPSSKDALEDLPDAYRDPPAK